MTYKTLHRYIALCGIHGWKPSWAGLFAYAEQERSGIRERWRRC